jgi:hypothetical protein
MTAKAIEQCVIELDGRLRSHELADLGPVTIGHGRSLSFEDAVRTTLSALDLVNRRRRRGAWIDSGHERLVTADVAHLHWLAEFRERRR